MFKRRVFLIALALVLVLLLSVTCVHPFVIGGTELSARHSEAVLAQARGFYSSILPLIPIFLIINDLTESEVRYTIYYFPFGTVGMSYLEGDGYSITKPLV